MKVVLPYTIQSVNVSNYFSELRADVVGAYYAFYLRSRITMRGNGMMSGTLKLLYQTMRALTNPHLSESVDPLHFRVENADNQRTGSAGVPVCTVWRPDEAGSVQRMRTCV